MLPLTALGLSGLFENRLGKTSRVLILVILILLAIQFMPIMGIKGFPVYAELSTNWSYWSISPSRSMEAVLFAVSILGFALFVAQMSELQQQHLMRYITLGFVINLLIGVVQLSFGARVTITGVLPFEITSAMFANENHFASLIYMMIPLFAWRFLAKTRQPGIYIVITAMIVFFQFGIGSRAGMVISSGLAVLSFIWASFEGTIFRLRYQILILLIIAILGLIFLIDPETILNGDYREIIFPTTWKAILDHWLTGTGLGGFLLVYPMYEVQEDVIRVYANQAHSDYLQLLLELGFIFIPVFMLFLIQIIRNMFRSTLARMASVSLFAVLAHSIIDYPMRTMAIAIVFATLSAVVLSERDDRPNRQ